VIDEAALYRKLRWRLVPYLLLLYVIAWFDRVNIGFAALQMNADLGFSDKVYGFGAGIFFAGYALFEVPSNLILARVGARRWIARIMVSWGLLSVAMMFVEGKWSFYALRFALGVAEACPAFCITSASGFQNPNGRGRCPGSCWAFPCRPCSVARWRACCWG
jgi:MFS family permease